MGAIDKILSNKKLPERDDHNSRIFIDVAENIHFHYREHRIVFSVEEFIVFARAFIDAFPKLMELIKKGYTEMSGQKTIIIGGSQTEKLPFENPKKSAYFDDRLQIEKQVEGYGDVIHIHYRDYRLVLRKKETWKKIVEAILEADKNLEGYEWKE